MMKAAGEKRKEGRREGGKKSEGKGRLRVNLERPKERRKVFIFVLLEVSSRRGGSGG